MQNIVLEQTCERIISAGLLYYCLYIIYVVTIYHLNTGKYCDIHLGVYIVRGDNIALLCEIDIEKEANEMPLIKVEPEDLPDVGKDETVQWNFE